MSDDAGGSPSIPAIAKPFPSRQAFDNRAGTVYATVPGEATSSVLSMLLCGCRF